MSRARLRPARATVIAGAVTLVLAGRTVVAAAAVAGAGDLQQHIAGPPEPSQEATSAQGLPCWRVSGLCAGSGSFPPPVSRR